MLRCGVKRYIVVCCITKCYSTLYHRTCYVTLHCSTLRYNTVRLWYVTLRNVTLCNEMLHCSVLHCVISHSYMKFLKANDFTIVHGFGEEHCAALWMICRTQHQVEFWRHTIALENRSSNKSESRSNPDLGGT